MEKYMSSPLNHFDFEKISTLLEGGKSLSYNLSPPPLSRYSPSHIVPPPRLGNPGSAPVVYSIDSMDLNYVTL